MSAWIDVGFNSELEGGFRKVRMNVSRVPVEGERFEFWNPDGSAADIDPELDGNVFFVAEVSWVCFATNAAGATGMPIVFLIPKSQLQSEEQEDP